MRAPRHLAAKGFRELTSGTARGVHWLVTARRGVAALAALGMVIAPARAEVPPSPAAPAATTAPGTAPAALPVQELRLANGMRLLLVRRPGLPGIAAGWVARVGSANERPGTTGVTHFLEHMLFKGTPAIAAPGELWRLYTAAGAAASTRSRCRT